MNRFFGALMMAVGGLIAVLSSLCSFAVLAVQGANGSAANWLSALATVAVFGGIPFAIGAVLVFVGRGLYRLGD